MQFDLLTRGIMEQLNQLDLIKYDISVNQIWNICQENHILLVLCA